MKNYFLIIITLLLFNGCTTLNELSIYKNKLIKNDWNFEFLTLNKHKDDNIINKFNNIDNAFFTPKKVNIDVNIDENTIHQFEKKEENYDTIPYVYKKLINNQDNNINDYVLKPEDYLTLYKMLYINQNKIFKKEKYNIINRFLYEIDDYINLDFKQIKIVMENENFDKINKLKQQLLKLEKGK